MTPLEIFPSVEIVPTGTLNLERVLALSEIPHVRRILQCAEHLHNVETARRIEQHAQDGEISCIVEPFLFQDSETVSRFIQMTLDVDTAFKLAKKCPVTLRQIDGQYGYMGAMANVAETATHYLVNHYWDDSLASGYEMSRAEVVSAVSNLVNHSKKKLGY